MKVAIVTIYSAFNYGSFLQAYAMQEVLKRMGHEVVMLNCSTTPKYKTLRKQLALKKPAFSLKRLAAYQKDWKKLNITTDTKEKFDVAIIGSDEVWNIAGSFEQWPQYFGEQLNADRIVAYAPSIGFSKPENLLKSKRFVDGVKRFDAICPRDDATRSICMELSDRVTERVVDPTLLFLEQWEQYLPASDKADKYVVYYGYLDDTPMKKYIKRFAQKHNFKVYIAGFDYAWGDTKCICSPLEFLSLLKNAEYVFTSTFHGSVFSTILQKNMIVRPSGQKVTDYLKLMNLSDRVFEDTMSYEDFERILSESIDYSNVRTIQTEKQEQSMRILQSALLGREVRG